MSLPVSLRREAQEDFDEAFDYYDGCRPGLGGQFVMETERVFERIAKLPHLHPIALADIRKAVVRYFPYCVYYRPHADRIEIIAVFCTKRDPEIWHKRV